jgi:hypothetical protein
MRPIVNGEFEFPDDGDDPLHAVSATKTATANPAARPPPAL